MTRQQALEKAAREKGAGKDQVALPGLQAAPQKEPAETSLPQPLPSPDVFNTADSDLAGLSRFADALGSFLETLREASAYGPSCELEGKYDALREELRTDYPALRPVLTNYIEPSESCEAVGFDFHRQWSDPFERLTLAESLDEAMQVSPSMTSSDAIRAVQALKSCWSSLSTMDHGVSRLGLQIHASENSDEDKNCQESVRLILDERAPETQCK